MSINATDVKLQAPERLTDNADGGGLMTGTEIVDGQVNNLFPDISRLDRTAGRVNLRKFFAHVDTANTDTLYGAHLILTQEPADPLVHLTTFAVDPPDLSERSDAENFVEKYVVKGPVSDILPWDTQTQGQRAILCFKTGSGGELAANGDVYVLSIEDGVNVGHEQYLRITSVATSQTTLTDPGTNLPVTRTILTLGINKPLDIDYPGSDAASSIANVSTATTKLRMTNTADAAKYYGVSKLSIEAVIGDTSLQLDSIFSQIVPATTQETPVVNQPAGGAAVTFVVSGAQIPEFQLTGTGSGSQAAPVVFFFGSPIAPGSLSILSNNPVATYTDVNGVIYNPQFDDLSGTIDYATGQINISLAGGAVTLTITFTPAAAINQSPYTNITRVLLQTQSLNNVSALSPKPAPGTIRISYRALGRWYTLRDDGRGSISGILANTGSGAVQYGQGTLIVTLGALPDVGSAILIAWGETEAFESPIGSVTPENPIIEVTSATEADPGGGAALPKAIDPSSVTITWTDGTAKTATDNGTSAITGDADGRVEYAKGSIRFRPNTLPAIGTIYHVAYQTGTRRSESGTGTIAGTGLTGTLTHSPIKPGTVRLGIRHQNDGGVPQYLTDDGSGNLVDAAGTNVGTITYSSGAFSIPNADKSYWARTSGVGG